MLGTFFVNPILGMILICITLGFVRHAQGAYTHTIISYWISTDTYMADLDKSSVLGSCEQDIWAFGYKKLLENQNFLVKILGL